MSYRCKTCRGVVPTNTPRLTHVVKRLDGSIARELAVCQACHDVLTAGATVATLVPTKATEPEATPVVKSVASNQQTRLIPTGE